MELESRPDARRENVEDGGLLAPTDDKDPPPRIHGNSIERVSPSDTRIDFHERCRTIKNSVRGAVGRIPTQEDPLDAGVTGVPADDESSRRIREDLGDGPRTRAPLLPKPAFKEPSARKCATKASLGPSATNSRKPPAKMLPSDAGSAANPIVNSPAEYSTSPSQSKELSRIPASEKRARPRDRGPVMSDPTAITRSDESTAIPNAIDVWPLQPKSLTPALLPNEVSYWPVG